MESKWTTPYYLIFAFSPLHLWLGALVVWFLGFTFSLLSTVDWFSRSGAVTIALLLAVFSLNPRNDPEFQENLENGYFPSTIEENGGEPNVSNSSVRAYYAEQLKARIILRAEAQIAAVATLIWGFGDIAVKGL
jgi:hypothetical protein